MKALLYGVMPEPAPEPETDNYLLRNLAHTPMKLVDMDVTVRAGAIAGAVERLWRI